jgi:hypothetical protein
VVVAINLRGTRRSVPIAAPDGGHLLLSTVPGPAADLSGPLLELRPYEAVIVALRPANPETGPAPD